MILLRLISWPYFRKHVLRSALTVAGIVLGVAVLVAMHTANQAVVFAFQKTVDNIAGATQLQVTTAETGFPEEVLERVQAVPQVRVAVPVIEAVVDTGVQKLGNLLILGLDLTGDRSLRTYDLDSGDDAVIDDPLVFLAQPDSILVTREFAAKAGLQIGSRFPMRTMDGEKQFTVRGVMRSGGLTSAFGGNLAVMDIYAAQKVFGRGRMFDRIDLAVKDGARIEQVKESLSKMLGPGFEVAEPSARGQQLESLLRVYSATANLSSAFALFMGMFIIYNSFAIAVTQRRSEIGILRALGASQGQIRTLFLGESAAAGVIGSALGVGLGILWARGLALYIGALLGEVYGVAARAEEASSDPRLLTAAFVLGVLCSMVAAFIPARAAARVDPVQALQKGKYQVLSAGENRVRRIVSGLLAAFAVACVAAGNPGNWVLIGYGCTLFAALLMTPTLALWLARSLRPVLKRLRPVEGALAADSLIQAPRRTSATVAALMLSLALCISFAGMARASYNSIVEWMDAVLNPDFYVATSKSLTSRTFRFPASLSDRLMEVPGVREVQIVRSPRIMYRGSPVMLVSSEVEKIAKHVHPRIVDGDRNTMYRRVAAGEGVIISDNLAQLNHLHLNDVVEIPSPSGILKLPVVGITIDYSDQQGSFLIDRAVFVRYWKDDTVNVFRVYVQPGSSFAVVRQAILEKLAGQSRLFVLTNEELRKYIMSLTEQWFGLTYVQIFVAVLVAVLGIVNTLTVSITDRRRELGVLRAVGGVSRQIRHTVWMEALAIGVIGVTLGIALGSICLYYMLEISGRDFAGIRLGYEFPYTISLLLFPAILSAAFLAALWPARSASSGSLVEALEYE